MSPLQESATERPEAEVATAGGSKHDRLLLHCHDLLLRSLDRDPLTQGHQDDTTSPSTLASFLAAKRITKT